MTKRILTDVELEAMARKARIALETIAEIWSDAMKTLLINSSEYKRICTAGKAAQRMHRDLFIMAEDRRWSEEKLNDVFSRTYHGFS